jgi:hypothetical protein
MRFLMLEPSRDEILAARRIATEAAAVEGGYEATNALFAPVSGSLLVAETSQLLSER